MCMSEEGLEKDKKKGTARVWQKRERAGKHGVPLRAQGRSLNPPRPEHDFSDFGNIGGRDTQREY